MPKILLIDDDAELLAVMATAMEAYGFQIVTAADGRRGVKAYHAERPDLVVTDVVMPEEDGIGAMMALRQCDPRLKIIAISGGGMFGRSCLLRWASHLGADVVLGKPFRMWTLASTICQLLGLEAPPAMASRLFAGPDAQISFAFHA